MGVYLVDGILHLARALWFSLILRPDFPPVEAPKCTLMAAVALTKAFHKMGLTDAGIKVA